MPKNGYGIVDILLRSALLCIGLLPRRCLCGLSNALAFLTERVVGYRRRVVMDNLRKAFPNKPEKELRRIASASYRNFFDVTLNIFRIRYASQKRVMRSVAHRNPQLMNDLYLRGRSGILLAGHYSCWEYIGTVKQYTGHRTIAAYQPLSFAPLERIIAEGRERFGATMTALRETFRVLLDCQARGELTMTLMVSDQSPAKGSCSHWLTLLGQLTPVLMGPERIAQKLACPVLYLRIVEQRRFCYEYELVMLSENAALEKPMAVTKKFYEALEADIIRSPQRWMWMHRRWKNQHRFEAEKICVA
ncbi:MAG: lysophospholipid acyltransferase family protein [Prevotellaceae bacterium]|jgi:KDO2-lipid IV(A) lauroyltransferase|nr:lysophospholipid acyltransferase family protein [Prevotellaceae bacterium]